MTRLFMGRGVKEPLALTVILLLCVVAPTAAQNKTAAKPKPPASPLLRGQLYRHSAGWSFRVPPGWAVQADDQEQFKLVPTAADANGEGYGLTFTPSPKIDDVYGAGFVRTMDAEIKRLLPVLSRAGEPRRLAIAFGPAAVLTWDGETPDGTRVRARTYTAPFAEGAISLLAVGTPANLDRRNAALEAVFASLRREAPPKEDADTVLARTWRKRLAGMKLTRLESYNSGSSGGYSSRTDIVLRADGGMTFAGNSSVSVYVDGGSAGDSGTKKGAGKWRIFSRGTQAFLAVTPDGHPTEFFVLTRDGEKTLLNGRRWFVTPP